MKIIQHNYVKYGLIMSGIILLCLIYMEVSGQNQSFDQKNPIVFLGMMVAPFVVWFFGLRAKKRQLKNKMTFQQGVREGFLISLVYGITSPFVFVTYYLLINPSILEYVRTAYNLQNAAIGLIIAADVFVQFVSSLIFGTIYAAIISFFLKTKTANK
jgi:hypothetical protein